MGDEHGWQAKVDALRRGAWRCGEAFVDRSGEHRTDAAFDDAIFNRDNKLVLCCIVEHVGIERYTGANIPNRAFDAIGGEFASNDFSGCNHATYCADHHWCRLGWCHNFSSTETRTDPVSRSWCTAARIANDDRAVIGEVDRI